MVLSSLSKWMDVVGEIVKIVFVYDDIFKCFNDVMIMIDCECFKGNELDFFICVFSFIEVC